MRLDQHDDDERPAWLRGFDALGLGLPRHELLELLAMREESAPFDHARLASFERDVDGDLYVVGSKAETKRRPERTSCAHWYAFVPGNALELACTERLLGARPARVRERARRALTFADRGPLRPAPSGVYREAVVVAGAMMALGESTRAATWLERLGDRDADVAWATTFGADDERLTVRHRGWTGFRAALRMLAAGHDDDAIELAKRTRQALAVFVDRPAFALLDAHTSLLAAVAQRDALGMDHAIDRTDVAWRQVFAQPGFELDVRVAIDFIGSGLLAAAHERGIVAASKLAFGLPVPEPAWVRGLVVAERGASVESAPKRGSLGRAFVESTSVLRSDVECPACGTATRLPSTALHGSWPLLRRWVASRGPLEAWGTPYERVSRAARSSEPSILTPPAAWSRCPECAFVLLPILVVDEEDRTSWRLDAADSWTRAAECTWAPSVTFETPWRFAPDPVSAGLLRWMIDDVTR